MANNLNTEEKLKEKSLNKTSLLKEQHIYNFLLLSLPASLWIKEAYEELTTKEKTMQEIRKMLWEMVE